jgi:amino acid transporter
MNLFRKKTVDEILKRAGEDASQHGSLSKQLGVRDLTSLGIAAIIGAGIFSTIGNASADGGPGVIFLFIFTAIACGFAAFAYAEFASLVPVSGSAYTYSYVAFGELTAWIIGWALIMEYGIGNITVAISWSDYFTGLLDSMGIHLPLWMTMDYLSASNGFAQAQTLIASGKSFDNLDAPLQLAYKAWQSAPVLGSFHFIADLPALLIIILITMVVYRGIKESKNASNTMVAIKLAVVLLVITVGVFYINTDNWHPFLPNGIPGVLKGVSAVFFAYIGFDAISTTAEECKNPQRDLPRGMMWAIIICTILYVCIALVLTGMVKYNTLAVGDPLAFVFGVINLKWMAAIVGVSAVVAMASVLLVFQLGQPRIWMSMSRDGLLPKKFATIHPKYKTPSYATIITGFVVAVPSLFMNLTMVTDLCSIGTLFAFVLVCAGVLKLQMTPNAPKSKFKTPYLNAKYIFPTMVFVAVVLSLNYNGLQVKSFFLNTPKPYAAQALIHHLGEQNVLDLKNKISQTDSVQFSKYNNDVEAYLSSINENEYADRLKSLSLNQNQIYESGFSLFQHKIPTWIFIFVCLYLIVITWKHNLSLIPLLGLVSCLYMMSEMGITNWIGFSIWLTLGLIIYFSYSYKHSKLHKQTLN